MREVTLGLEIESEIEHSIDLGSVLMSLVMAGHKIESEVGMLIVGIQPRFRSLDTP